MDRLWDWLSAVEEYISYRRHRAKDMRLELTFEHEQYYLALKGRYIDRLRGRKGSAMVAIGKTGVEALEKAAIMLRTLERHADA